MTKKTSFFIRFVDFLEKKPLWIAGFILLCLSFLPCLLLGENALFHTHDTYDGALLTYILKAKHLGDNSNIYPELMNGLNTSGMEVPAPIFVLLYYCFKPYVAHLMQYVILSVTSYFGMYLCCKYMTGYKGISTLISLLFALLPLSPVYANQVAGLPLLIYAFICLYEKRHLVLSYVSIAYFVFSSSMVIIGFACIGILFVMCVYFFLKKRKVVPFYLGSLLLLTLYLLCNANLIYTIFFSESFVSHRVEIVLTSLPFFSTFQSAFLASIDLAQSCHRYMIIPIFILHILESFRYRYMSQKEKKAYKLISFCLGCIILLCLFYAFNFWEPIINLKNLLPVTIRHFQFHRVCLFLPVLWYFVAALSLYEIWEMSIVFQKKQILNQLLPYVKVVVMFLFMAMTIITIRRESYYRWNLNQLQNPSVDYGISFAEYFAEEQFLAIKNYIGKPQDSYKVASLGICPSIPLYNGFYCIDGYSNNYPLTYKHRFRQIIEKEIEKNPIIEAYYDGWGSRCYLFAAETGTNYDLRKGSGFSYQNLELNTQVMKEMGCNYLLSAAPILNADDMDLSLLNVFTNDTSLYDIYLYILE